MQPKEKYRVPTLLSNPFEVTGKISAMREFIAHATKRLDEDGYLDEDEIPRLDLVVERGELSWFSLLSEPGPFKIWVGLTFVGEELIFDYRRIDDEEATFGGISVNHLPRIPEDLDEATLPLFDPHFSHPGTVLDWKENTRWVKEGVVVQPGYMIQCYKKFLRELIK